MVKKRLSLEYQTKAQSKKEQELHFLSLSPEQRLEWFFQSFRSSNGFHSEKARGDGDNYILVYRSNPTSS